MRYLLDTNVLSELRKGDRCDPAVAAWKQTELIPHQGAVSVIALGEIRMGIERLAARDPLAAAHLEQWLQGLQQSFAERILPVTGAIAEAWGHLNAQRPLPAADSLMGATAQVHNLILATRNTDDLRDTGVRMTNPFAFPVP